MSETDDSEPGSLVPIMASELYPKSPLVSDDESLSVLFPLLCGESVQYLGRTAEGVAALSNFRFFVRFPHSFVNIPLGLVDSIECRDIFYMYIYCKDARSLRCTFSTNESCLNWYKRLSVALTHPTKLQQVFAFAFHAWCVDSCSSLTSSEADCGTQLCQPSDYTGYSFGKEAERLGFDLKKAWRICYVNEDFKVCGTYPKLHLVPSSVCDKDVESVAGFRTSRRFPSVVWRDVRSGAVLVRCSQPEVGWLGWRNAQDENMLQAISAACCMDLGTHPQIATPTSNGPRATVITQDLESDMQKMLIVDARSYAAAVANRAKGGGCECSEYYPNCEIQFMNLANIHTIRKSFQTLRGLCAATPDQANWLSLLENTKWLAHISGLMRAAAIVVNALDQEGRPVLVHCSDGWDRTPQITALAELLLDPYYRTIEGFRVLAEREWLDFGHKFADRCGHGVCTEDTNERCPVFLQYLDCVHQILQQFPCAFQFNEAFLVKLVQHAYSCLFGTFLGNHSRGRLVDKVPQQTSSVWSLLSPSNTKFRNYLYTPNAYQVLRPSCHLRHMNFWTAVYLSDATATTGTSAEQPQEEEANTDDSPEVESQLEQLLLPKTRSCDDIVAALDANASTNGTMIRRSSDPNITTDPHCLLTQDTTLGSDAIATPATSDTKDDVKTSSKQIVIQDGKVRFNAQSLSHSDISVQVSIDQPAELASPSPQSPASNQIPAEEHCEENSIERKDAESGPTEDARSSGFGTLPVEHELAPVHSSLVEKVTETHSSFETAVETSTDTLTGELEQGVVLGNTREPTISACAECNPDVTKQCSVTPDDAAVDVNSNAEDEVGEVLALTARIKDGLKLERSTNVSTSTTDISDSHVLGGLAHAHSQHKGALSMQNLLKLHIPESGRRMELGLSQTQILAMQAAGGSMSGRSSKSSCDSDTYTPPAGQSRTPSSSSPTTPATETKGCWRWGGKSGSSGAHALDIDGLVTWMSAGQGRLVQMESEYQSRIEQLRRQLHTACLALSRYACGASGPTNHLMDCQDNNSLADSQESAEHASSLTSDMSWEQVEEKDARMTLWVPDHAVTHCAGCDMEFWIVRRRHHCRNCGRVFCNECTNFSIPVPQQQLITPVRVCRQCFITIIAENPNVASSVAMSNGGSLTINNGSYFTNGSSGVGNGSACDGIVNGSAVVVNSNHFLFSNGNSMMNGNGNLATPTCNGVSASQQDRQVAVSTS